MSAIRPDLELLFGVLGGARVSGQTGVLIRNQLNSLVGALNSNAYTNERKIRLTLDQANTKNALRTSIRTLVNQLNNTDKLIVKVSRINADSALHQFQSDLEAMLGRLKVSSGFSVTVNESGAVSAIKEIKKDAQSMVLPISEVNARLKEIKVTSGSVDSEYKNIVATMREASWATEEDRTRVELLKSTYIALNQAIENVKANKNTTTGADFSNIEAERLALLELMASIRQRIDLEHQAAAASSQSHGQGASSAKTESQILKENNAVLSQAVNLQKRMASALKNFTAASGTEWYSSIRAGKSELDAMLSGVQQLDAARVSQLSAGFTQLTGNIHAANMATKSLGSTIVTNAKKFSAWWGVQSIIVRIVYKIWEMIKTVKELDTAMTELKKVTDETDVAYKSFLTNSAKRAKQLGATITDVINASADFARLGYGLSDSAVLADAAIVYKNVGDGIEDINTASESIISTLQAFGIEAQNVMTIVDKFNNVGNNFAISSAGVGEALLRSASAMHAAGNSIDETIAIAAAANTVIQDPEKVGTALKTLSMYLRAAQTEAEEAGENTDGMANSISELRHEILALTGHKVDIQLDENSFKSTYQIIKELSGVWDELTDISRANILELIGGKRNSNVTSALLENFDVAEKALAKSIDSAGSALKENEKYLDSIAGKVSIFKANLESLSWNIFDSETLKIVVDIGSGLLVVADALAKINMLLPVIIGLVASFNYYKSVKSMALSTAEYANANAAFIMSLTAEDAEIKQLTLSYAGMSAARQADIRAMIEQMISNKTLGAQKGNELLQTLNSTAAKYGEVAATSAQTGANYSLAASIKAVLATNPLGWVMMLISLLPTLINLIKQVSKTNEQAIEKANELTDAYKEQSRVAKQNISVLEDMKEEFVELSEGVDEAGENVSLTNDEYSRYLELANQIAGINPSLVSAYDDEGNAILRRNQNLIDGNELLKEAIRLQEEYAGKSAAEYVSDKNIEVLAKGAKAKVEEAENEFRSTLADNSYDNVRDVVKAIASTYYSGYAPANTRGAFDHFTAFTDNIEEIIDRINTDQAGLIEEISGTVVSVLDDGKLYDDAIGDVLDDNDIASAISHIVSEYNTMVYGIEAANGELRDALRSVPVSVISVYKDLDDTQREFLSAYIANLDTTSENIADQKANIVGLTKALGGELTSYFVNGDNILGETANKLLVMAESLKEDLPDMTFDEYDKAIKDGLAYLERQDYNAELNIAFKTMFGVSSDSTSEKYTSNASEAFAELTRILNDEGDNALKSMELGEVIDLWVSIKDSGAFDGADGMYSFHDIFNLKAMLAEPISVSVEIDGMSEATEKLSKLRGIMDTLETAEVLDPSTLVEIQSLLPEAASGIYDLETAISAVNLALSSTESEAKYHFGRILISNVDTVDQILNSNESLRNTLASIYGDDVKNWQDAATGKFNADATLIQELVDMWAQYRSLQHALQQDINQELVSGTGLTGLEAYGLWQDKYSELHSFFEPFLSGLDFSKVGEDGKKQTEEYLADIDKFQKEQQKLDAARAKTKRLEDDVSRDDSDDSVRTVQQIKDQITLRNDLIDAYEDEQDALHELNEAHDAEIQLGAEKLRQYGVEVDYDPVHNELYISNLEAIKKAEGATQEETNELRKSLEDIAKTIVGLNQDNIDNSTSWLELKNKIEEAGVSIVDVLANVVERSNDAVDSIQNVYDTLHSVADEFAANDGFISVDSFQSIIDLGPQYMQFLKDENGLLTITEEKINDVIKAKTEQLAVDAALAYVLRLKQAVENKEIETLNNLLYATEEATGATWKLVDEILMSIGLSDEQLAAARHNIQSIQQLAQNAIRGIGRVAGTLSDELSDMQDGVDSILGYVEDMLQDINRQQIEAIEDQKEAFAEYIDLQKESIRLEREREKYNKTVADKTKDIAKIQAQIDALSLDDSREAQAERARLQEELAGLQGDLADTQADHAVDLQEDALDKSLKLFEDEKDKEIKLLEDMYSSAQKLHDAAMTYIKDNWASVGDNLIAWNAQYGSNLTTEIESAWDNAIKAAQRYGDFLSAYNLLPGDIQNSGSGPHYDVGYGDTEPAIRGIVGQMIQNSNEWTNVHNNQSMSKEEKDARKEELHKENERLAEELRKLGIELDYRGGAWYLKGTDVLLYNEYGGTYHSGGIAGGIGTLKENELLAKLEEGEAVISNQNKGNLFKLIEFVDILSRKLDLSGLRNMPVLPDIGAHDLGKLDSTRNVQIHMGDVIIQGNADQSTVDRHMQVNRDTVNEIARILGVKR